MTIRKKGVIFCDWLFDFIREGLLVRPKKISYKVPFFNYLTDIQHMLMPNSLECIRANLTLQCPHNERDRVSDHQRLHCLLNRLFRCRSKKTSKLRFIGLCEGISLVTGEFLAQRATHTEMFPFDDVISSVQLSHCPISRSLEFGRSVFPPCFYYDQCRSI